MHLTGVEIQSRVTWNIYQVFPMPVSMLSALLISRAFLTPDDNLVITI